MLALIFAGAWAGPAWSLAPTGPIKLAPHRAVYDMSLGEARSGSGMVGIKGRMVYEFTGTACLGYTLNMRLVTQISDRTGESTTTDLRSSTFEKSDGSEFRFTTTQLFNENASEVSSGEATRASDGTVKLTLKKPTRVTRELPAQLLFPTQHSLMIIKAAEEGRTLLQAMVYDGSEKGEKLYLTTTFIGKMLPPGSAARGEPLANEDVLGTLPAWPVSISYFDSTATGDVLPSYQLTFILYANGVSRDIEIDYGDFVLRGNLRSIDFLPSKPCR
jgi:hypothetical protein